MKTILTILISFSCIVIAIASEDASMEIHCTKGKHLQGEVYRALDDGECDSDKLICTKQFTDAKLRCVDTTIYYTSPVWGHLDDSTSKLIKKD